MSVNHSVLAASALLTIGVGMEAHSRPGDDWANLGRYHSTMADARGGLPIAIAGDGVHPNEAGYRILLPLAEAAIGLALSRP